MSNIQSCKCTSNAPATADVQIILEVLATDKMHIVDRNLGLAWRKSSNGIYNMQNCQLISSELENLKLYQTDGRNVRTYRNM